MDMFGHRQDLLGIELRKREKTTGCYYHTRKNSICKMHDPAVFHKQKGIGGPEQKSGAPTGNSRI